MLVTGPFKLSKRPEQATFNVKYLHNRFPDDSLEILHCLDILLNPSHYPAQADGNLFRYLFYLVWRFTFQQKTSFKLE